MNIKLISVLAAGLLSAAPAFSSTVTLDFEGIGNASSIDNFYNGGSGPDYGVSFGLDALAFTNIAEEFPLFSNAPTPGTIMGAVNADSALNVASGFAGQASFYYSTVFAAEDPPQSVNIWSGLNGTGSVLATYLLTSNAQADGCSDAVYCHWDLVTLDFAGIAQSIVFADAIGAGFDNITVAPVPLPAAAWLLLSGLGGLGIFSRRKQIA